MSFSYALPGYGANHRLNASAQRTAARKPSFGIPSPPPLAKQALPRPLGRIFPIVFAGQRDRQELPVVNLQDFTAHDSEKRSAFIQALGKSLQDNGFVAIDGHEVSPELMADYYESAKDVFALPKETKESYVTPELGRNRGYYELGRERKAAKVGGEKKFADLNEKWQTGPVGNIFPTETQGKAGQFQALAPRVFNALEKTAIQIADAIGQFLESQGIPDKGYLKSQLVSKKGEPIGSHLMRTLHYPPVTPEQMARFNKDEPVIRAGEHYDLNLFTLLPPATENGLEILRRHQGKEDRWTTIDNPKGHLICNAGDSLSLISGGTTNERCTIDQQGALPSIRHRVVADEGTLDKDRYSTAFFVGPHYDGTLKNLVTGKSMKSGKFLYGRLKGHGSLDPSVTYEKFRQDSEPLLRKID